MAKSVFQVTAFNAGELGPLLYARADFAKYASGLMRCRNAIPLPQGPVTKRPGSRHTGEVKDSASQHWNIPFVFSRSQAFVLEFGNQTLRFYTNRAQVTESAKTITAATNASPGVFTINAHGWSNGDEIFLPTLTGMTGLAGRNFRIANVTTNTFTLTDLFGAAINTTSLGTFTAGTAARIYQIATPWPSSALTDTDGSCLIEYAQSNDVVYITVPGYQPRKLTRLGSANWTLTTFSPNDGPFKTVDPDQTITVYASAATGTGITITASSSIFTANHVGALFLIERKLVDSAPAWEPGKSITAGQVYRSQGNYYEAVTTGTSGAVTPTHTEGERSDGHTGVTWRYLHSGYGWVRITAQSGTTATADVISRIPADAVGSGNATTRWAFGAWSAAEGWPTHVAFFRERLSFWRGSEGWFSVPSDFESFLERDNGVVADDSAFKIDIRAGQNDTIAWLMPSTDLLVGTDGGEFSVRELSTSSAFSPTNRGALSGPGYGARKVRPVKVNDAALYAQNSGRKLRELRFSFETDGYVSLDRTVIAHHIAQGQIVQLAYTKEPTSIVWAALKDGGLLSFTYDREQDVQAFALHTLGGVFGSGSAVVESVCVIPSPDQATDDLWLIVKRTINGVTKRYQEYIAAPWDEASQAASAMVYVDSSLGGSVTGVTVNGLHHLQGETVKVLVDAAVQPAKQVSATGSVTLDQAAVSTVQAGLGYSMTLRSLPMPNPGFIRRIVRVFARFLSTLGVKIGPIPGQTVAVQFRDGANALGTAVPPFSGVRDLNWPGGSGRDETWTIEHDEPTAFTLSSLLLEVERTTER